MANLTLKDLPENVHRELRARAERHRRSLNREAIACLEAVVLAERIDPDALLARARAARRRVTGPVAPGTVRRLVLSGRP
jgi:antitoxin FitA